MSLGWRSFVCFVFVTILKILSVTLLRGVPVLTSLCLYCICYWTFCHLHCYEVSLCWRPFVCIVFVTILNILSVTLLRGVHVLTSLCLFCICYNTENFVCNIVTRCPCVDVPLSVVHMLQYWTFCLLHCDEVSLCWRPFVCIVFVTILNILSVTLLRGVPVLTSLCLYCICCWKFCLLHCYEVSMCWRPYVCIVFVAEHFVCYIVTRCPCVDVPLSVVHLLQYWTFCLLHCYEVSLCWRPFVCIVFVTILNILSVTLLRGVPVLASFSMYCICHNTEHFVSNIVTRCPCVDVPLSVLYLLQYWKFCLLHCYEVSLCWRPFVCIVFVTEHFVIYIVTRCPCVDVPLSVLYLSQYWTFCQLHCYEVSLCWRPFVCIVFVKILNILSVTLLRVVPVLTSLCLYCICYNTEHFVCYIVTRCPCVDVPLSVLYLLQYWTFCLLHCYEVSLCWCPFVCIVFVTILNILSVTLLRDVPVLMSLCLHIKGDFDLDVYIILNRM